ncbi:MAG: hypothetical protein NUV46_04805 [Nanoarchaeota archaeon]|nr:hypothetical protein [Nanoarchaeota archaeon]
MNKGLKIVLGLILLVIPIYFIVPGMPLSDWGDAAWKLIQGGITITVIVLGIVLITLGINDLRN